MVTKPLWTDLAAVTSNGFITWTATSITPHHSYLIVSAQQPAIKPVRDTATDRTTPHHNIYVFNNYYCLEQLEPGSTTSHTFALPYPDIDTLLWAVLSDDCDGSVATTFSPLTVWQFLTDPLGTGRPAWISSTLSGLPQTPLLPTQAALNLISQNNAAPTVTTTGLQYTQIGQLTSLFNTPTGTNTLVTLLYLLRPTGGPISHSFTGIARGGSRITANVNLEAVVPSGGTAAHNEFVLSAPGPFPHRHWQDSIASIAVTQPHHAYAWGAQINPVNDVNNVVHSKTELYGPWSGLTLFSGLRRYLANGPSTMPATTWDEEFDINTQPPFGQRRNVGRSLFGVTLSAFGQTAITDVTTSILPIRRPLQ